MSDRVAALGINNLSKFQVFGMAKEFDSMVDDFRNRLLAAGLYCYIACGALTMKVCEGGRVVKTSVLLATGVNADGYRESLGMHVATSGSVASWAEFFLRFDCQGPYRGVPGH